MIGNLFSAVPQITKWILFRIDDWLFPGIAILYAHPFIDRERKARLQDEDAQRILLTAGLVGWQQAGDAARAVYEAELARRDSIERKAVSLVGASGTIFAIVTAAGLLGALLPEGLSSDGRLIVACLFIVPIACFALAFYFAINSWRVGTIAWIGPAELRSIALRPVADREIAIAVELILATEDNERILLKRINYLDSAERWVNRGVVAGLMIGIVLLSLGITTDVLDPSATKSPTAQ